MKNKGFTLTEVLIVLFILLFIPLMVFLEVIVFHWAYTLLATKFVWPLLSMWESFAAVVLLNIIGGMFKATFNSESR